MNHRALRVAAAACLLVSVASSRAWAQDYAGECEIVGPGWEPAVGVVDCARLPEGAAYMGAAVPFSYYVPAACAADDRPCPVLYYTHGTGGSYREFVGARENTSSRFIAALTSGPPVDPSHVAEPWQYADAATWIPLSPIDLIVVVPEGRTLPGGFGPAPGLDTGWTNWNPRYAAGGDTPRYDTPPPRIESFMVEAFVPFVDASFPTIADRTGRGIVGTSQGGFGSYKLGLAHPDLWSSLGMFSGGGFPIPTFERVPTPELGIQPPDDVPYIVIPGPIATLSPEPANQVTVVSEVTVGFGDPVADQAFFRSASPFEIVTNARASAGGVQSLHLRHMVNDTIPRRVEDFANPTGYAAAQAFESILLPMNLYFERILDANGIEREFEIHPGIHSTPYWAPFFRSQLAAQYANLRHADGSGSPRPWPVHFDYRTIETEFSIWGWVVTVDREPVEFLEMIDVTCESATFHGTGVVTAIVPESCGTGVEGSRTLRVDLGPDQATDEMAGLSSSRAYGRVVTVELTPLE